MNPPAILLLALAPAVLVAADRMAVGLTTAHTVIEAVGVRPPISSPKVLIIGGLDGDEKSAQLVVREAARRKAPKFLLLAIPRANPDKVHLVFPPSGRA